MVSNRPKLAILEKKFNNWGKACKEWLIPNLILRSGLIFVHAALHCTAKTTEISHAARHGAVGLTAYAAWLPSLMGTLWPIYKFACVPPKFSHIFSCKAELVLTHNLFSIAFRQPITFPSKFAKSSKWIILVFFKSKSCMISTNQSTQSCS